MKHTSLYVALFSIASTMTISSSCTNKSGGAVSDNADSTVVSDSSDVEGLSFDTIATETFFKADTTRFSSISMKMELPTATDGVEGFIRSQLCHIVGGCISYINCYEDDSRFPLLEGKDVDNRKFFDYYFKNVSKAVATDAKSDYSEREKYYISDTTFTDEQRKEYLSTFPTWAYDYTLVKVADTLNYVVFLSQFYTYTGGAHGGIGGDGDLTFSKVDGKLIEHFVDSTKVEAMQPLLREGLKSYFAENGVKMTDNELFENLQIGISGNERTIPLPMLQPFPTGEGLVFTYQQYEVACYAAGMPSFVVPYNKIAPNLTEEASRWLEPYLKK